MNIKLVLLLMAGALAIVIGVHYTRHVDPEIVEANEALHQARSWHAEMELHSRNGAGLWSTVTVVCPDRTEFVLRGVSNSHTIRIGDRSWTQDIAFPHWTEVPNNENAPDPCRFAVDQPALFATPVARAMAIAAEFDRAVRHHLNFSRGEMDQSNGEACRNWTVDSSYTLCLSEKDHLPLIYTSLDGSVKAVYTQWNEEIAVSEPENKPYVIPTPTPLPEVTPYIPPKPSY
ncbi:MAG TPA: hypothetical protein VKW06_10730 [Candidatus Angelobacter sp.]|nr:hypothetical protein [Candidatus Angelobacter sp.]